MSASAFRYVPRPDGNAVVRDRIVDLAQRHRRYGAGMIYLKLRQAGAEDLRKSAGDRQAVQGAGDRQSPEGPRRDDRHGLMGGVVDNGQALHDPPIRRAIEDEVRGPDLVATLLGAHQWLAVGSRDLLASTALQLEPGLRVQAIDYVIRRRADGRTKRDIIRCLQRFLAREIYQRVMRDFRTRQQLSEAS